MRIKLGTILAFFYLGVQFLGPKPDIRLVFPGLFLILAGEGLRVYSASFIQKKRFCSSGPYAHMRHPLYTGSFLLGLGFVILLYSQDNPLPFIVFLILYLSLFYLFYSKTIKKEEERMTEKFEEEFLEYRRSVPLFFPRLKPYQNKGGFRWRQILINREYQAISGVVVLLSLYFIRYFWY